MKIKFKILVVIFSVLLLSSCCQNLDPSIKKVYVDKVFMNEIDRYTFFTKNSDGITKVWEVYTHHSNLIKIIDDVPENEKMYVEYYKKCSGGSIRFSKIDIHIHNLDDIQGGSWNHGKFGSGQTMVIE